jgi:hypothetical protein
MNDEAAPQGRPDRVPSSLPAASAWSAEAQDAFYASVGSLMERARHRAAARAAGRIWRAMMLAPTLEVCGALLCGETVPVERLDPDWVKRFGVKS